MTPAHKYCQFDKNAKKSRVALSGLIQYLREGISHQLTKYIIF